MSYHNYPILKLLIPYILGILLAYFGNFLQQNIYFFSIIIILILLFSFYLSKKVNLKSSYWGGGLLFVSAFIIGFLFTNFHFSPNYSSQELETILEQKTWIVTLTEAPIEKKKSLKLTVSFQTPILEKKTKYVAIIYIEKEENSLLLQAGDILIINSSFSLIDKRKNPESFDQQTFLRRKGIYFTTYVPHYKWDKLGHKRVNIITNYAQSLQTFFASQFASSGLVGQEYDIITAILLGADDTMDPELKSQYASAGVSHILCVSGMHVGIMFMMINFLLKPLDFSRKTHWYKILITIFFIWFYAAITGFSPSVKRAAVMFSFASFGSILKRNTNIFHSLYASLFILLLSNPLLLFEIGFQLSYLAVFGIVLFQKRIFNLIKVKTKVIHYFWELASVSIAAQLATFPIAIYYFGQFPNYFLISNLSVIFLSFIIMISGIITLFLSFIPIIVQWVAMILTYEIKLMNWIVKSVDQLPGALTEGIYYTQFQTIMLYFIIIFIFLFFLKKKTLYFIVGLGCFVLFSANFVFREYQNSERQEITIYHIPKMSAINFNSGGNSILLSDSINDKNCIQYNFSIKNHERKNSIKSTFLSLDTVLYENNAFFKQNNFIYFVGKKIYIYNQQQKIVATNSKIVVDYLIIEKKAKVFSHIFDIFQPTLVIIDGSNSYYENERWAMACQEANIPYHSIIEKGSLSLAISPY